MDHLPYPANPAQPRLDVPLLVSIDKVVDCQAERHLVARWRETRHLGQRNRKLQHWFYFGLLSRCIAKPVQVKDFHSDEHSGRLSTKKLPAILAARSAFMRQNEELLRSVELELWNLSSNFNSSASPGRDEYNVHLHIPFIRVLLDAIWRASRNRAKYCQNGYQRYHETYEATLAPATERNAILSRLLSWQNGWCPSMVACLIETLSTSTLYYLSSLRRHRRRAKDHKFCTAAACRYNYEEKDYQQPHTKLCESSRHGGCRMVDAPQDEIMQILQDGGIPLLKLANDRLVATKAEYGLPYVAINHVWAGGLGNPKGNAMRLCQLKEISDLTSESRKTIQSFKSRTRPEMIFPEIGEAIINPLRWWPEPPPQWFWLDTLNIPKVDDNVPSLNKDHADAVWSCRTLAIDCMTQTYAAAEAVILLDPELRSLDLSWDPEDKESRNHLLEIIS